MDAIGQRNAMTPTIVDEAFTIAGYFTRVAAGLGVGVADAGHLQTLRRPDIVVAPLLEDLHIVTYLLHKRHRTRASRRWTASSPTPCLPRTRDDVRGLRGPWGRAGQCRQEAGARASVFVRSA